MGEASSCLDNFDSSSFRPHVKLISLSLSCLDGLIVEGFS